MTRKELIRDLARVLKETYVWGGPNNHHHVAEAVVQFILDKGMKPPVEKYDPILLRTKYVWEDEK